MAAPSSFPVLFRAACCDVTQLSATNETPVCRENTRNRAKSWIKPKFYLSKRKPDPSQRRGHVSKPKLTASSTSRDEAGEFINFVTYSEIYANYVLLSRRSRNWRTRRHSPVIPNVSKRFDDRYDRHVVIRRNTSRYVVQDRATKRRVQNVDVKNGHVTFARPDVSLDRE